MNGRTDTASPAANWVEILCSPGLAGWLAEHRVSIGFTTYQAGKLFLVGQRGGERIAAFERTFNRCMGLCVDRGGLWMSSLYQLWRFENGLTVGARHQGYDSVFVPRVGYTTGDLDIHDIAVESDGRVVFIATAFNCLATLSPRASFRPLWRLPFISKLAAEDRCHLNGLALVDGTAAYVMAASQSDVADGWRDRRGDGGCVVDIRSNEVVAAGLSMPHSPRWNAPQGRLFLQNSGTGWFGSLDLKLARFEPIAFCPGYLRGLAFVGDYAIVGLSRPRRDQTFDGLAIEPELARRRSDAQTGLHIIDLKTGAIAHWLKLEGEVRELYDVVVLPGVTLPMALGFKSDEIRKLISVDET